MGNLANAFIQPTPVYTHHWHTASSCCHGASHHLSLQQSNAIYNGNCYLSVTVSEYVGMWTVIATARRELYGRELTFRLLASYHLLTFSNACL